MTVLVASPEVRLAQHRLVEPFFAVPNEDMSGADGNAEMLFNERADDRAVPIDCHRAAKIARRPRRCKGVYFDPFVRWYIFKEIDRLLGPNNEAGSRDSNRPPEPIFRVTARALDLLEVRPAPRTVFRVDVDRSFARGPHEDRGATHRDTASQPAATPHTWRRTIDSSQTSPFFPFVVFIEAEDIGGPHVLHQRSEDDVVPRSANYQDVWRCRNACAEYIPGCCVTGMKLLNFTDQLRPYRRRPPPKPTVSRAAFAWRPQLFAHSREPLARPLSSKKCTPRQARIKTAAAALALGGLDGIVSRKSADRAPGRRRTNVAGSTMRTHLELQRPSFCQTSRPVHSTSRRGTGVARTRGWVRFSKRPRERNGTSASSYRHNAV